MTVRLRYLVSLLLVGLLFLGTTGVCVFWLLPHLHTLRTSIDTDRATTTLIQQQQSNLAQLSKDIETIRGKQTSLDQHVWLFLKEDDFFTFFDTLSANRHISIDTPSIADATPSGALITRAVTLTFHGSTTAVLSAIQDLQRHTPLISLQQVTYKTSDAAGNATIVATASTLWK